MVSVTSNQKDYKEDLCRRYNALFEDRTDGSDKLDSIMAMLGPDEKSILLRHEACYVLGQLKDKRAVPILTKLINDPEEHEITRHEAAEALGAIGDNGAMDCLCQYTASDSVPLRETCELGVDRLNERSVDAGDYNTIDPVAVARGSASFTESDVEKLVGDILSNSTTLTEKYKALFALRSITDSDHKPSVKGIIALSRSLRCEKSSALLRHEIAFVIGQLVFGICASRIPECVEVLKDSVKNADEHSMVRHEAAIALGSIAGANEDIEGFLGEYGSLDIDSSNQDEAIVIESCLVARESLRYWRKHSC